eukprot:CAMPEP_0183468014 /NCGR_PEP_ID=MMETSP0370-20130417/151986_1 /TAXON_ID=268820 /ORGANISM="Peridinium aciculiferum, Strain PAER-2" /LENGTH=55 /DNA_ID=CAMNT_0025660385 /DNA_START=99 /DNA_END=263 /DNA_ORIENTATION=-
MTKTRSESMIVGILCAMHSVVHAKLVRTMAWSLASVTGSVEDVGSSKIKTVGPLM